MKIKTKDKRGILLASETLKIVLAVIGIALLTYLLFALYASSTDDKKLSEAKSTLKLISKTLGEIESNSSYVGNFHQITPVGWSLFSFVQNDVKPNFCSGQDCLCICDSVSEFFGLSPDRQEKECSEDGVCLIIKDLKKFDEISISRSGGAFTSVEIKKVGKWIEVNEK